MIGTKFYKGKYKTADYVRAAQWCNANNATIEDKGEYYEVVAIPEPEQPTLDELKAAKLAELKAERDAKEVEPIEYNGNTFDYDDKARDRINAAIIALDLQGADATLEWTTADNTNVTVTATDFKMVIAAVAVRSNALHVAYRKASELVEAATRKDELNSITLS